MRLTPTLAHPLAHPLSRSPMLLVVAQACCPTATAWPEGSVVPPGCPSTVPVASRRISVTKRGEQVEEEEYVRKSDLPYRNIRNVYRYHDHISRLHDLSRECLSVSLYWRAYQSPYPPVSSVSGGSLHPFWYTTVKMGGRTVRVRTCLYVYYGHPSRTGAMQPTP